MKKGLINIWYLISQSFREWNTDNASQLAAAIAYYTIFSIPPLLIIALAITGYFYKPDAAQNQIFSQMGNLIGPQIADFIKSLLVNSAHTSGGPFASIISIVILLVGASGIFYQVQHALNIMWDVPSKHTRGFIKTLKDHFQSYLMVLAIGILLLVFLILSTVISFVIGYVNRNSQSVLIPEIINFLVLFIMLTILIAMIYRVVPDKYITWADVWLGAAVTALLFMLGRYAIGFYLTISKSATVYGAAGSLIVLLLWIYYSAQIFLFGALFTQVYARKFGSRANAKEQAMPMKENASAPQGNHPEG